MQAHGLSLNQALDVEWALDDDGAADPFGAAEDDAREGGRYAGPAGWELASLVVLAVSGVGLSLLGWAVGLAMAWQSDVWSARDKRVALGAGLAAVALGALATAVAGSAIPMLSAFGPVTFVVLFGGALATVASVTWLVIRAFALA